MQTKDIFRTRTFRIIDRCTVFMLVFTCASFLVYIIGSYQAFLPDTMMMLLRTVEVSSLALIGCSAFALRVSTYPAEYPAEEFLHWESCR